MQEGLNYRLLEKVETKIDHLKVQGLKLNQI